MKESIRWHHKFLKQRLQTVNESGVILSNNLLTRQEKKIIQLVAEGARNKEIADNLNISAHTVKAHLSAIFRKTIAGCHKGGFRAPFRK